MKIVAISDTHGLHHKLPLMSGDMLIHAGDISMKGTEAQVVDFLEWFSGQPFEHKIFIAGNHDFFFESASEERVKSIVPDNVIYLNDSGVTIDGIKCWGSPISPWFFDWAFNRYRGADIAKHWALIPHDTDVVITHGPVYGLLDKTNGGEMVGCEDLLARLQVVKPQVHICGHIHEAYGTVQHQGTRFINASVVNAQYKMANAPVYFELEKKTLNKPKFSRP